MARKNAVRTVIQLTCTCDRPYTYHSQKNTRNVPKRKGKEGSRGNSSSNRLELRKYCPRCRSHQIFRETRR